MKLIGASLMILAACGMLAGQETQAAADDPDFTTGGEITVGYRFVDVSGYRPQFTQLFNLRDGLRVQDFMVRGESRSRTNSFLDSYSVSATGLGGDPFATGVFQAEKTNVYDLRVQWRQSYYYWNQNDNVSLPIAGAAAGLGRGLTANHDWATVRKLGDVNLIVHATRDLRLAFEAYRTTTDGSLLTTRSLEFFNAPAYWAAFARANPYPLNAPLRDSTHRFAGGADYTYRDWDFHYRAGFQRFREKVTLHVVAPGEVSINPITLSTTEPLNQLTWDQDRRLNAPVSEFSYRGTIANDIELRGGYTYARFRGPASLNSSYAGIAPGSSGPLAPYSVTELDRAYTAEPAHVIDQGVTWHIRPWWDVNVDYRYSRYTSHSDSHVESVFNGVTSSGESQVVWEHGLSDLSLNMSFTPVEALVLSPGIRLSKSDLLTAEDGVVDSARTQRAKHARPELRFSFRPSTRFSLRGNLYSRTSGASYTAITPHTQIAGHLISRFEPLSNLSIENALTVSSAKLDEADYRNRVRANTFTVSYALDERFSVFGSVGYESFFAQGAIVYARGTSPLRSTLRDQEIHRVWQGGVDVKPASYVGVRVSGNYDRLTGRGEIVGEPPASGPLTWPFATGTVYFDVPKTGRLSVDFQRTYYIEEIVPANNFAANLLGIRFTRTF